jgi:hypothetical protein
MGRDDQKLKRESGIWDRSEENTKVEAETRGRVKEIEAVTSSADHLSATQSAFINRSDGHDAAANIDDEAEMNTYNAAVLKRKRKKAAQKVVPRVAASTLIV